MRRTVMTVAVALALYGCGGSADDDLAVDATTPPTEDEPVVEEEPPVDLAALEDELRAQLETRDDGLGLYVTGLEQGGGSRVRVLTQLDESQTEEADAICNNTTAVAYGLDDIEVSGVDVAAAGGRNIAHCVPKV